MGSWKAPRTRPAAPPRWRAAANALLASGSTRSCGPRRRPTRSSTPSPRCEKLRSHLAAIEAAALAEVEDRKIAKNHLAWSSTGDWFTHLAGTHQRTGRRTVRHAKLLVGDRSLTRDALRDGLVSPEQAGVICDAIEELPTNPHLRELAEKTLLDEAGRLHATDLAKAARHLIHVVDPDGAERKAEKDLERQDRAAHLGRFLAFTEDGAGGVRVKGRGTVEDAARIKAALLPLTKPAPAGLGRTRTATRSRTCATTAPGCGTRWSLTCEHALATDLPPDAHGARPRIAVTTSLDALQGQIDWSHGLRRRHRAVSPAAVRRLACDADIIPVALGTRGEVLDVGRAHRLVTPALWRALVCRDRHCAFPGCTRPPVMGHAHHLVHWADGGPTALANLVLLCGHHHRTDPPHPVAGRLNPEDGRPSSCHHRPGRSPAAA